MKETRVRLGKFWKERLDKGQDVPNGITLSHPYIKEYMASIEAPKTSTSKPKEK